MVAVLFKAGVQVPVMPFIDVVGNGAMIFPEQIGPTGAKTGVMELPDVFTMAAVVLIQPRASFAVMV